MRRRVEGRAHGTAACRALVLKIAARGKSGVTDRILTGRMKTLDAGR